MTAILHQHLSALRDRGLAVEAHPQSDGWTFVIVTKYPLPDGYSKTHTDLLLRVPPPYPNASLDMFWTDEDLRLTNASLPANTAIEHYLGRNWLRFSWHPQNWHPAKDSIITFIAFVARRLAMRN